MLDYECADLIADIAGFYPGIKDPSMLANSYFGLIGKFDAAVARAAFMELVKTSKYFPAACDVYEQCCSFARRMTDDRALTYRGNGTVANLLVRLAASDYRQLDVDARTWLVARHYFPECAEKLYEANFAVFDQIREMCDDCVGCRGVCSRGGYIGYPRLNGNYVELVMTRCNKTAAR